MTKKQVYWGVFLITMGGLLLINSFGWLNCDFGLFLRLWPMFFIFWGLSLLKLPDIFRKILSALSAIFLALLIIAIITGGWSYSKHHIFHWHQNENCNIETTHKLLNDFKEPFDSAIKSGNITLDFGAGNLTIGDTTSYLFSGSGTMVQLNMNISSDSAKQADVSLSSPNENKAIHSLKFNNTLHLSLNNQLPWNLEANIGAAEARMNLTKYNIPKVSIDCGACDLELQLGDIANDQEITIECGASDIKIIIPETSGCRVTSNSGLSSESFEGFTEKREYHETDNYSAATKKININLSGGVSSFKIQKAKKI